MQGAREPVLTLRRGAILAGLFLLALLPRLYSAQTLGWGWDGPGSFNLVNFDEAGSCRAALHGFNYSPFIGYQTVAIASALGHPPPAAADGDERLAKAYCHSPGHLLVARSYSAVLGALTVVAVAVLTLLLLPAQPGAAWFAGALLAVSGFHISQSQSATVDAASTFFIYAFLAVLAWSLPRRSAPGFAVAVLLSLAAMWTKFWAFAVFAWLACCPAQWWEYASAGWTRGRIALYVLVAAVCLAAATNTEFPRFLLPLPLVVYAVVVPWERVRRPMWAVWAGLPLLLWLALQVPVVHKYTVGVGSTAFGSGYADIGANKWLRNLLNVPLLLLLALGLPACLFLPAGMRRLLADREQRRLWLVLLPAGMFALFMAFIAPVTYYRHYLPLVPAAAIIAAAGAFRRPATSRPWVLAVVLVWSGGLAWDMVSDYHSDPRREARAWYREHPQARVFYSFYTNPPPGTRGVLFQPEYAAGDARILRQADFVILSENWYDTAFANELNGPWVNALARLVKTTPEHARFYRQAIAGEHPWLEPAATYPLHHFMPELLLHRHWYGNFQLFVGDLRIFRVRR